MKTHLDIHSGRLQTNVKMCALPYMAKAIKAFDSGLKHETNAGMLGMAK